MSLIFLEIYTKYNKEISDKIAQKNLKTGASFNDLLHEMETKWILEWKK